MEREKSNEEKINDTLLTLNDTLERIAIAQGLPQYYSRRKMLFRSFLSGFSRGIGMAIGFSLLSAFIISILTLLASKNLPYIGAFIADVVRRVQGYMR